MKLTTIVSASLSLLLLASSGVALRAQGVNSTWNGGGVNGNWGNAVNWTPNTVPGVTGVAGTPSSFYNGDAASFKTVSANNTVNIDANNYGINALLFNGATGSYTIGANGANGGNALNFAGTGLSTGNMYIGVGSIGTIDGVATTALTNSSEVTLTIAAPILVDTVTSLNILNNGASGTGAGSAVINITGNITNGTVGNSPTVNLGGTSTNVNTISGSINDPTGNTHMGISINSAPSTWALTSTSSTFGGAASITAGTLEVASLANVGISSSLGSSRPYQSGYGVGSQALILLGQTSTAVTGTLDLIGNLPSYTTNRNIQLGNSTANGGLGVIEVANANTTLTLTGTILAASATNTAGLTLQGPGSGVLSGGIGGSGGTGTADQILLSTTSGTWTLSGSGGFFLGQGVNVNGGTLNVASGATLNAGSSFGVNIASGGTLGGSGTISGGGGVFINSGGILHIGSDNVTTGTTLTFSGNYLGTNAGADLAFTLGATGGAHTTLNFASISGGTNTFGSTTGVILNGSYSLGTYSNIITGLTSDPTSGSSWTVLGLTGGDTGTFSYSGGSLSLTLAQAGGQSAYFNGATSDLNTQSNFYSTAGGTTPIAAAVGSTTDVFLTGNTATATGSAKLAPTLSTGALTINSLTLTGTGTPATAGLALTGTSTLTIGAGASANYASGTGITVLAGAGADTISVPLALGGSQKFINSSSNLLTINGGITGTGNLTLVDGSVAGQTGGITLSGTAVNPTGAIVNSGLGTGTTTISAPIGAAVTSITQNSSTSALVISGASPAFTGGTFVQAGTLTLTGSLPATNTLALGTTGTTTSGIFQLGNSTSGAISTTLAGLSVLGTGTANEVTNGAAATSTLTIGASGQDLYAGFLGSGSTTNNAANNTANNLALVVNGAGVVDLTGANTYTGGTTVSAGTLQIGSPTALGQSSSAVSVTSGAVLDLNGTVMSGTNALTLNGTGIGGNGALINSSLTASTYAGLLTLGSASIISTTGGNINLSNTGTISGAFGLTLAGLNTGTVAGIIGTGANTLTKSGSGSWLLKGANTYTGGTTINGGTLEFNGPTTMSATGTVVVNNSGTLALEVGTGAFFTNATSGNGSVGGIFSGVGGQGAAVTLNSGSAVALDTSNAVGGSFTYSGNITNTGVGLTKLGTGTLLLTGANSYSGPTTITAGTLQVGSATALGASTSGVSLASGTVLDLDGTTMTNTNALSLSGNGVSSTTGALINSSSTAATYAGLLSLTGATTIGATGGNLTLSNAGTITGATFGLTLTGANNGSITSIIGTTTGGVTKTLGGTWTLGAVNTYTGATAINGGTLNINGSTASGSAVTVGGVMGSTSSTLGGTGTVFGSLTSSSANSNVGNIAPGVNTVGTNFGGTGTLTVAGATTIGAGTALNYDLSGTSTSSGNDLLAMTGTGANGVLTLGGTGIKLNVNATNLLTGSANAYTLVSGISTSNTSGIVLGNISLGTITGGAPTGDTATFELVTGTTDSLEVYFTGTTSNGQYTLTTTAGGGSSVNVHVSGTTALATTIKNTGSGTQDALNYSALTAAAGSGTVGAVTSGTTTGTALAQGATSTPAAAQTYTAGTTAGAVTVGNTATVSNTSGLAGSPVGASVGATVNVYNYANAEYTGATLAFGNLHVGAAAASKTVAIGNQTVTNSSFQDSLNASATTGNSAVSATGFTSLAASTGGTTTGNLTVGVSTAAATSLASTETLGLDSNGTAEGLGVTAGGATVVGSPAAITTTGQVYSGLMIWSGAAGNTWATDGNWNDSTNGSVHVAPGLDPSGLYNNTDTATFNNTTGSGGTVNLAASSPSLKSVTFSSATGYTLAQGSGGTGSLLLNGTSSGLGSGNNALVAVTTGTHTISAPIILTTSSDVTVSSGQQLTMSGPISSGNPNTGLAINGAGTTILSSSAGNTFTGPTAISGGGKTYITNATGSGTGSGAITVSGTNTQLGIAGNGSVSGAITVGPGGSLYSGALAPTTTQVAANKPGAGTTSGVTLTSALNVNGGNLTFALAAGGTNGVANPNTTTSFISTNSAVNFTGADNITLVDLSNGGLTLRQNSAYLLISDSLGDSGFSNLVIVNNGVYTLNNGTNGYVDGYVAGVYNGSGPASNITPFTFTEYGADGVTPLTNIDGNGKDVSYLTPTLYLYQGKLEVVPEPGTWALMLSGLAVLAFWQRRKSRLNKL